MNQTDFLNKIKDLELKHSNAWFEYWKTYSNFSTWQFWVNLVLLLLPLVALYFFIDKKRALLLGFFGLNVHIWFTYIDAFGVTQGFWIYAYKLFPVLPTNFALDVALVPVIYILVYQWTLNNNKNFYLYLVILSLFFAFVFKPLFSVLGLFEFSRGGNYFYLFLGYVAIGLISKLLTNLFIYFEKKPEKA